MEENILGHYSNWLKLNQQSRDNKSPIEHQSENKVEMEAESSLSFSLSLLQKRESWLM